MVEAVFFYIAFGNIGFLYAVSEAPWRRNVPFTWNEERLNMEYGQTFMCNFCGSVHRKK